jgi:hypothetical protein
MDDGLDRRKFLAAGTIGLTTLGGCSQFLPIGEEESSDDDSDDEEDTPTPSPTPTATPTATATPTPSGPQTISYGQTMNGEITSNDTTDLYFSDEGVFYADRYVFTGSEGDPVAVSVTADGFDGRMRLVAPDGTTVRVNADGGEAADARVARQLQQNGEYTVWVTSASAEATGSYSIALQTGEDLLEDINDLRTIAYGETREGTIEGSDPQDPEYDGVYYAEPVAFTGSAGDRIEITMTSEAFSPWIHLVGPDGETVIDGDDGDEGTAQLTADLTMDGEYTVWCQGFDEETTGPYTLTVEKVGEVTPTPTPEDGLNLRSISYGQTAQGELDEQDPYGYRGYYEPVTFEGTAGDVVTISMSSADDTYLMLQNPAGDIVAENDDYDGLDSQITEYALEDGGTYTIIATSYSDGDLFEYTLTLNMVGEETPTATPPEDTVDLRSISYGQTKQGYIDQGDPTDPEYDGGIYYAEPVDFNASAGDEIEITMTALDEFSPWIRLEGPDGETVIDGDDGGEDVTTFTLTLEAGGEYTAWCQTFDEEVTGAYSLRLVNLGEETPTPTPAEEGTDLRSIEYGQTKSGYIDLGDPTDPGYPDSTFYAEPVTFDGTEGDEIEMTMTSNDFSPWIRLEDPNGETAVDGDDGGEGTANLPHTLDYSGEYTIWCQAFDEETTGAYELTLELL